MVDCSYGYMVTFATVNDSLLKVGGRVFTTSIQPCGVFGEKQTSVPRNLRRAVEPEAGEAAGAATSTRVGSSFYIPCFPYERVLYKSRPLTSIFPTGCNRRS